jgi:serine/threonine protein kinase
VRAISELPHPHICQLFDVGREGAMPFLVMELVSGETLAARLARGPLPFEEVVRCGRQIAGALDASHRAGIVHRDLKPGNVMLPKSGNKLLDFGLAKSTSPVGDAAFAATAAPQTATGSILGTVPYMAPEQLEGRAADARSDIYALGLLIYEMATGERYFGNASRIVTPAALGRIVRGCWRGTRMIGGNWRTMSRCCLTRSPTVTPRQRPRPSLATGGLPWLVAAIAIVIAIPPCPVSMVLARWASLPVLGAPGGQRSRDAGD